MTYNWDWGVFWLPSPDGDGTYGDMLLRGLGTTLLTALCAWAVAFASGSAVGVLRTLPGRVAPFLATCWIELFRNIPLLVQLFLWFFVLPEFLPRTWGTWLKQLPHGAFYTAVVGIGFYMSARLGVQLAAGLGALPPGQLDAGTALGLSRWQCYRLVLLPVAYRTILPPMTSDALATLKNTSVALTIGLAELTAQARAIQEFSFQVFEAYAAATVLYGGISLVATFGARWVERRLAIPGWNRA